MMVMENEPIIISIKPVHLALGVGAIVIAIVALPFINSVYTSAYPPSGSVRRQMIDYCVDQGDTSRWSTRDVERCVAYQTVTGAFRKAVLGDSPPVRQQTYKKVTADSPF
jgi:hypothetical protein